MTHKIVFAPEAQADLSELYDFIADQSYPDRAYGYITRIQAFCNDLANFPERGRRRDDLRPGLRVTGFERRVTIAFHFGQDNIVIDRIAYGGRDVAGMFATS